MSLRMRRNGDTGKQRGSTLIEVLVALIIISTVLLGVTILSVSGLSDNQAAYFRSQANLLAYDLADRIRVNSAQRDNYAFSTSDTLPTAVDCTSSGGCTAAELRDLDVRDWAQKVAGILPSGAATVAIVDADVLIRLQWEELDWNATDPDTQGNRVIDANRSLAVTLKVDL